MESSATSPGAMSPTTEKRRAAAASPICQSRDTALRTIFRVMAPMMPTTAALNPPRSVATSGVVP